MVPDPPRKCQKCSIYSDAGALCDHLDQAQLETLGNGSRTSIMKRGNTITGEELLIWPILAISAGVLSLQHLLEDGRKTIAALFMQGDILDMRGVSRKHRGHLIALDTTHICRLSPDAFEAVVEQNNGAQKVAWNNLRSQTYRAMDHAADLAKKQAQEKLASFIFECRRRQIDRPTDEIVEIPIRRIDLADYLGMQPETVSRCFKELESKGIVGLRSISRVKILNAPRLRRIANGDRHSENLRPTPANKETAAGF